MDEQDYNQFLKEIEGCQGIPSKLRIYADEHISPTLVEVLRQSLKWDVRYVLEDEKLRSLDDKAHYRKAAQDERILLTQDDGFLNMRKFPLHLTKGVVILKANTELEASRLIGVARDVLQKMQNLFGKSIFYQTKIIATNNGITMIQRTRASQVVKTFYPIDFPNSPSEETIIAG